MDFQSMTIANLKQLAKEHEIKIPSSKRSKSSIIAHLKENLSLESVSSKEPTQSSNPKVSVSSSSTDKDVSSSLKDSILSLGASKVFSILFPALKPRQIDYLLEAAHDLLLDESVDSEDVEIMVFSEEEEDDGKEDYLEESSEEYVRKTDDEDSLVESSEEEV